MLFRSEPHLDVIAVEVYRKGLAQLLGGVDRAGLTNVRFVRGDGVDVLEHMIAPGTLTAVRVFFPDPWPKARHHKRRVVQDASLAQFHRILLPRGEVRIVTDHDALWAWNEEHAERNAHLFDRVAFERPASAGEGEFVGSNFERKYRREGRRFHAMTLRKR